MDRAVERQGGAHRVLNGPPVEDGQRAGRAEADRTGLGIRRRAVTGAAAAKDLALGQELRMNLEPDGG